MPRTYTSYLYFAVEAMVSAEECPNNIDSRRIHHAFCPRGLEAPLTLRTHTTQHVKRGYEIVFPPLQYFGKSSTTSR